MRFDDLFDDLAGQMRASDQQRFWGEAEEMSRAERSSQRLCDRVAPGTAVRIFLDGALTLAGRVHRTGEDYLLVEQPRGREFWWIPVGAIQRLDATRLPRWRGEVSAVPWRSVLRAIARDRGIVRVHTRGGDPVTGRLAAVGHDHLQITGEGMVSMIPLGSLVALAGAAEGELPD